MKHRLAYKFLIAIIGFSLLATITLSFIQVYNEFDRQKNKVNEHIQFIEKNSIPSLEEAIWIADEELIKLHLNGLLQSQYIVLVSLELANQEIIQKGDVNQSNRSHINKHKLYHSYKNQKQHLGDISIYVDESHYFDDVAYHLVSTLSINAITIFLVGVVFYFVFTKQVGDRLFKIVDYLISYDLKKDNAQLTLSTDKKREDGKSDEIDSLVDSINALINNLKDSEAHNNAILNTAADAIFTFNNHGYIKDFNKSAEVIFGFSYADVVNRNIDNLVFGLANKAFHDMEGNSVNIFELDGVKKDGSKVPLEISISEMRIASQRMFSCVARDITERKRLDRIKTEFVATVSHELRTPLTSIKGSLGLLLGGVTGELSNKADEMLRIANNNTDRLLIIINDILDVQKIESGELSFNFSRIDLNSLIKSSIEENLPYAHQHGIGLVDLTSLNNSYVMGDPDRLSQVMYNLISNAVKFSPKESNVEVSSEIIGGDTIRIFVRDYGPGIPEEFHNRLFDRFTQADSSATRKAGGTGLGLSISKAIIDKHDGKLDFESEEGKGTRFYFDLQRIPEHDVNISP